MASHPLMNPVARISSRAAILITIGLTAVALLENLAPWGPFYVVYAASTVILGWRLRARHDGVEHGGARVWWVAIAVGVGFQIVGALLMGVLVPAILTARGVPEASIVGPRWSLDAALQLVTAQRAAAWGAEARTVTIAYLGFVFLWAGFGEEVFYRGMLHGTLQSRGGFAPAAIVSACLFALRHATQLVTLGADYPWGAVVVWMLFAFLFGLAASALYARTRRLGPPILAHYVLNLIPFVAFLASPPR